MTLAWDIIQLTFWLLLLVIVVLLFLVAAFGPFILIGWAWRRSRRMRVVA